MFWLDYKQLFNEINEENNDKRIIAAITVIFKHLKMYNELRSHSYFAVCELDIICCLALDIALGNHALRKQPTDYSLICRYRLVNNL